VKSAAEPDRDAAVPADDRWPVEQLGLRGVRLQASALTIRAASGQILVDAPEVDAEPGTVTAVVGPNGAGKSTWLRAVLERAGRDPAVTLDSGGSTTRILLLPQDGGGFSSCTVRETLQLAARAPGRSRDDARRLAGAWIERLGLGGDAERLCSELAAGRRRLLDLARVLLAKPDLLLCDEPLAGLDADHRTAAAGCLAAVAAAGGTVVLSEHDRDAVAALAGRVVLLERAG